MPQIKGPFFLPPPHLFTCILPCASEAEPLVILRVFLFFCFTLVPSSFWTKAVDTGEVPSPLRFLPSIFIAHRVQQSHCSSIFHRVLPPHAFALSARQLVHKKKSQRIYTSMHLVGLELTKLTYTRLEDNLIRHRGDRSNTAVLRGTIRQQGK